MSITFQTTLNGKNFRGTVNVKEALEALKGNKLPQIYKKDGTKYSTSYQKRLQNTREYFIIMTIIEERKRQMEQKIIERIIKGRQTKKEHQKEQNIYDFFTIFNDGINDPEINI